MIYLNHILKIPFSLEALQFLLFISGFLGCEKTHTLNTENKKTLDSIAVSIDSNNKIKSLSKFDESKRTTNEWETFNGTYFRISYPKDFLVKPSIKADASDGLFDSVFFISPDGTVEFYIYSPLWNGNASDITFDDAKELSISDKTNVIDEYIVTYMTFEAKDKSYTRSYVYKENFKTNNLTVFGINYRNRDDYDKYIEDYSRFKKSIEQWSD